MSEPVGPEVWPYRSGPAAAAFFDLDRTLISGAAGAPFARAAARAGLYPKTQLIKDTGKLLMFRFRGASDERTAQLRDQVLATVKGNRQADLVALNGQVIPKLLDEVRPEARALLELHRRAGRDTYIVSASPVELVEPLAHALGMTGGIGTMAEVEDGVYTGALARPFNYGPGKVDNIRELAEWEGYDLSACYAYSDSISDLPMLEAVGHPVAVNPDAELRAVAEERGWPVVVFHRRTRRVLRRTTAILGTAAVAGGAFAAGFGLGRRRAAG